MGNNRKIIWFWLGSLLILLSGCSYHQNYVQRQEVHAKARYVAVLPLVNHSAHANAGRIVGDLLTTELYALSDFKIMERTGMLQQLIDKDDGLDIILDRTAALEAGKRLGVYTVIFGSVTEYRYKRGLDEDPVVGINLRMLDVKTDTILWAGSKSDAGGCFWFCEDSLSRLSQDVCHDLVAAMLVP